MNLKISCMKNYNYIFFEYNLLVIRWYSWYNLFLDYFNTLDAHWSKEVTWSKKNAPFKLWSFSEDVFVRYSMNIRAGNNLTTKSEREKKVGLDRYDLMLKCVQIKTKRMKVENIWDKYAGVAFWEKKYFMFHFFFELWIAISMVPRERQ